MALQRVSTPEGARLLLRRLVETGKCRVEDFDFPPPGHLAPETYRNLLRDEPLEPRIEVTAPRDFVPPPVRPTADDWANVAAAGSDAAAEGDWI